MQGGIIDSADTGLFTIPANSFINIPAYGEFIGCLESDANFEVQLNNGNTFFFAGGLEYRPPGLQIETAKLINNSGSDIDVLMAWGAGSLNDRRLTSTSPLLIRPYSSWTPQDDVELAATDTTLVIAANTDRKKVRVTNPQSSGVVLRLGGDDTVAADKGDEFVPGAVFDEPYTGAVYAYNPSGDAVTVTVSEES